jgi:hypothetical protein
MNNINDSFYPYFKSIIENCVKDVQKRVFEAEKRVYNGEFLTQESYEEEMNRFFKEELGFDR